MTKHKWHKEIKAWADGAEIEWCDEESGWQRASTPNWHFLGGGVKFRIKPDKWAKEKQAFKDGLAIEYRNNGGNWVQIESTSWRSDEYRIKPQPKEPVKLFVIQHIDNKSIRLSADGFYTNKLENMIGRMEVLDD